MLVRASNLESIFIQDESFSIPLIRLSSVFIFFAMGWGPSNPDCLPSGTNQEPGWRLDIVSLLAILGESLIKYQAQPLTASWTCLLPRLLPAPQVLLLSSRPTALPDIKQQAVLLRSGTLLKRMQYFPNIMHSPDKIQPLEFGAYRKATGHPADLSPFKAPAKWKHGQNNARRLSLKFQCSVLPKL